MTTSQAWMSDASSTGSQDLSGHTYSSVVLRTLLRLRRPLCLIALGALTEGGLAVLGPWSAAYAINSALPEQAPNALALLAAGALLASLYRAWVGWGHRAISAAISHRVEAELLPGVFRCLLNVEYRELCKRDYGSTSETVAAASAVSSALSESATGAVVQVLASLTALCVLYTISPSLTWLGLCVLSVTAALGTLCAVAESKLSERLLTQSSEQRRVLQWLLNDTPALRVSGVAPGQTKTWERLVHQEATCEISRERVRINFELLMAVANQLLIAVTTVLVVFWVLAGVANLGDMLMATLLVQHSTTTTIGLMRTLLQVQALKPYFTRVTTALSGRSVPRVTAPTHRKKKSGLELRDVWFRYNESQPWVFERLNKRYDESDITVLNGRSGCGKSTMFRLLAGILRPTRGQVHILGCDPAETDGLVAYLPQNTSLLEASVMENLRVWSGASDSAIERTAGLTGLRDALEQLPMRFETQVLAGGVNVSSGQRQLILLTAACASQCPVILLDEPTSHLDRETESRIQWGQLSLNKTMLVARHD